MQSSEFAKPYISTAGRWALLLASGFALMSTAIPSPSLPQMAEYFSGREQQELLSRLILNFVELFAENPDSKFVIKLYVLSVAALFIAIGSPITGFFADRYGRRPVLIISLVVFAVSGAAGYFMNSLTPLLISRAILGLAAGGIRSATGAMVGDLFSGEERNRFLGLQSTFMKWGGVLFLILGSWIANYGWRPSFLIYLLSFLVLPLVIYSLQETLPKQASSRSDEVDTSRFPLGLMCYVAIATLISNTAFFATPMEIPFFVAEAFPDLLPIYGGVAAAFANTVAGVSAMAYFWLKRRLRYEFIFGYLFVLIGVGYYLVSLSQTYTMVLAGMAVCGVGFGMVLPNQSAWILSGVSKSERGLAMGVITFAMYIGQFVTPIFTEALGEPGRPQLVFEKIALIMFFLGGCYLLIPAIYSRFSEGFGE